MADPWLDPPRTLPRRITHPKTALTSRETFMYLDRAKITQVRVFRRL
jgi:hypothetical protein